MKNVRIYILSSIFSALATPVFAEVEGRVDDSHLLTYIFLAVCGLIVLFQLVPVLSLVRDLLKGSSESQMEVDMEELEAATNEFR